jgi:hypothetical protein
MYIEAVPNRNSPPAILLRESYREDGKIKKRTLLNLTDWPTELVEGFRTLLKGGKASPVGEEAIIVHRSFPHGHVAAVLGALRKIGLDRVLGPAGNRCRDLVMAMVVMRLLSPEALLSANRGHWGIEIMHRNKDVILREDGYTNRSDEAPRNIFSLIGFALKILKSASPSPTRAIEQF